ncbi:MAG: hypothetical protein GY757_25510 [bacterium]|nr:hypothetical protein [bacterium]
MSRIILFIALIAMFVTVMFVNVMPADDTPFIRLKPVATSQTPDDLIISQLRSVEVDDTGNVYGFSGRKNGKECCVIKWDKNLRFIKKFARQGFGPGEISMKSHGPQERLSIDPFNGDVVAIDYNPTRLVIFDKNGTYKKDINLLQMDTRFDYFNKFKSLGKGNYVAFKPVGNTGITECVMFSLDPLKEKVLYNFNDKPITPEKNSGTYSSDFYGSRCFIDSDSQYVVIAGSQAYKFQVFDSRGNKVLEVFDKNKKRGTFTAREMEYFKKTKFQSRFYAMFKKSTINKLLGLIAENKNPVRAIRIGGNLIYLFLVNDDITVENKIPTVIYDMKGKVVKKVYFKKIPTKIWQQFVYYTEIDEDENPIVAKYQIDEHQPPAKK